MKLASKGPPPEQGRFLPMHHSNHLSYSEAVTGSTNVETEIMIAKIEALLQADLSGIKAELHKFQALETKVEKLDSTVSKVQKLLSTLETGQKSFSDKLDKLCLLLIGSSHTSTPKKSTRAYQPTLRGLPQPQQTVEANPLTKQARNPDAAEDSQATKNTTRK